MTHGSGSGCLLRGVTMQMAKALAQDGKISPSMLLFLPKCMYNWEKEERFGRKGDV